MSSLAFLSPDAISQAAATLRAGELVAFPTETVYGLGADATQDRAIAHLYATKGRPTFNPLIAHVENLEQAQQEAIFSPEALALANAFWPGPLTLVLPVAPTCQVALLARAGLETIALRVPAHPVALALIKATGRPLVAPSANRSGYVSPTLAEHVRADYGKSAPLILDGGPTMHGLESTIISCLEDVPQLLRPGALAREDIEKLVQLKTEGEQATAQPIAPGMLTSHYAPHARVRLNVTVPLIGEAVLDFEGQLADFKATSAAYIDLSRNGDLEEAAANLFHAMRALDANAPQGIAVAHIPNRRLGHALNDRLKRAAVG